MASFERGSRTRAAIIASASDRIRDGRRSSSLSRPSLRAVPSTAAACPWGRERRISKASPKDFRATPPLSRMRSPSTISSGNFDRLARVRFLTLPPSRKDSRRSTAGGDFRLGTRSIYMTMIVTTIMCYVNGIVLLLHGYIYPIQELVSSPVSTTGYGQESARFGPELRARRSGPATFPAYWTRWSLRSSTALRTGSGSASRM